MEFFAEALAAVSVERIRKHIQSLEGVRHPVAAPAALEKARLYINDTLHSLGYSMGEQRFSDNGGEFSNVIATRSGTCSAHRRYRRRPARMTTQAASPSSWSLPPYSAPSPSRRRFSSSG